MRQAAIGQARNLVSEHDCRRVRGFEEAVIIRQLKHLFARDLGQLIAAIADIDAPKASHAVQYAVAVAIVDVAAIGMGDDPAAAKIFNFLPVGLRGQVMGDVKAAKFSDVVIAWHECVPQ